MSSFFKIDSRMFVGFGALLYLSIIIVMSHYLHYHLQYENADFDKQADNFKGINFLDPIYPKETPIWTCNVWVNSSEDANHYLIQHRKNTQEKIWAQCCILDNWLPLSRE